MPREVRDVVFVDGVRTPFGKAGGMYANTRADDLVIRCIRELMRRNPQLPPERVEEVAIAATTQIGDQGLTIGRTAALLAGLPKTVPGYSIDRMCAGAHDRGDQRGRRHRHGRVRHRHRRRRRAHGPAPDGRGRRPQPADPRREAGRPVRAGHGRDRGEPARPAPAASPRSAPTRSRSPRSRRPPRRTPTASSSPTWCRWRSATPRAAGAWPPWTRRRARPRWRSSPRLKTPFRPHGKVTAGNAAGLNDGATASLLADEETARELGLPVAMRLVSYGFVGVEPEIMGVRPDPVDREGAAASPA